MSYPSTLAGGEPLGKRPIHLIDQALHHVGVDAYLDEVLSQLIDDAARPTRLVEPKLGEAQQRVAEVRRGHDARVEDDRERH